MTEARAEVAVELFWAAVRRGDPHPEARLALACTGAAPAEMRTIHELLVRDLRGTEPQKGNVLSNNDSEGARILSSGSVEVAASATRLVLGSLDGLMNGVEVEQPFIDRLLASHAFKQAVEKIVTEKVNAVLDAAMGDHR